MTEDLDIVAALLEELGAESRCRVALTYDPVNRGSQDILRWTANAGGFVSAVGATPLEALAALRSVLQHDGLLGHGPP